MERTSQHEDASMLRGGRRSVAFGLIQHERRRRIPVALIAAVLVAVLTPTPLSAQCGGGGGTGACGGGPGGGSGTVDATAIVWFWQGSYRQAQLRALETDSIGPHHNLEIQPLGGGSQFYNNFHIRYLGVQTDPTDGVAKHTWRVSDSVTGATKDFRSHYRAYDPTSYGCQVAAEGVVWDIAEWISSFAGNDPLPLDLITQKIAPVGNDQADLLSALQDLCQENTTPAPTTTAPPTVTPAAQTSTVGTPARWSVSVSEDPSRPTTLLFDYGDSSSAMLTIPQGSGTASLQFQHNFSAQGTYDGKNYRQTFLQFAVVMERGAYASPGPSTQHTC